jgi:hypothetical protein
MSYNGSGTYVPPAGQPVTTGTVIQSATFNTLVTDIGNTFNNVLPRDGQAAMQGQLKLIDGTSSVPGIAFNGEASSGMFRPSAGALALAASGVEGLRINSAGRVILGTTVDDGTNKLQVNGAAKISGSATLGSTLNVTGAATLASTLNVTGATSLSSVSTSGAAAIGTTFGVTGGTSLSTLSTSGAVTLGATLSVTGNTSLSSLSTSGAATVGTTLNVIGAALAASFTGPLTGNVVGNLTGNVSGNATSASKLTTARTINGVSFDGMSNIQLPTAVAGADGSSYLLSTGYDLNSISSAGFYRGQSFVNAPGGNQGWFYLIHEHHDGTWAKQTATEYGSGNTPGVTWIRTRSGTTIWNAWSKIADAVYNVDQTVKVRRNHYGSDNTVSLNSIQQPEIGFTYGDSPNGPGISGPFIHFGGLNSSGAYTANYGCQLVASYNDPNGRMSFRTRNDDSGTWNLWREIWHTGNMVVDTVATPNSVVKRDPNGYLLGSYINMSDDGTFDNANNVAVTGIITKKGDNYYRHATAQQVKNYLGLSTFNVTSKTTSTDLNVLIQPGMYPIKGNPVNGPNGGASYNTLLVIGSNDHDVVTQLYGDFASSKLWTRSGNNYGTSWAPWRRLAWADNDTLTKVTVQGYTEKLQSYSGTSVTLDPTNGTLFSLGTTGNMSVTLPAAVDGMSYTVVLAYGGAHTVTFAGGGVLRWAGGAAPTTTSVSGKVDKYVFTCIGGYTFGQDGGRNF